MLSLLAQTTGNVTMPVEPVSAATATAAVGLGIGLLIFWVIFGLIGFIFWVWALIDVIRRKFNNPNDKILWLILVIVLGVIGAIVYLIAGRKNGTIPA